MSTNGLHKASRIVELADTIQKSVAELDNMLKSKGLPAPSFDEDASPDPLPSEAQKAQDAVLDATAELHDILLEPTALVLKTISNEYVAFFGFISRHDIPNYVPLGGRVSFTDIAKKTGVDESIVKRLLRSAMCRRVFQEPEPGQVAHTKASKAMRSKVLLAFLRTGADMGWYTIFKLVDAVEKWPDVQEQDQTAFNLAHNVKGTYFENVAKDAKNAELFASGMATQWELPGYELHHLLDGYDWAGLGNAKVIDVGGFRGRISIALAERFPNLDLLVQDMEMNEADAHAAVPDALKDRVHFMSRDIFTTQPVHAEVYYIRQIFHDWSDKYCTKLLRAHTAQLEAGARVLIHDCLLPEVPGTSSLPLWKERDMRAMDLGLVAHMNGRERSVEEWHKLVTEADPRFKIHQIHEQKNSMLALIEVVLET
ncbi:sterigmatocystin 8-O-methyltransferase [Diaporthe sp. PMI_573]|nr:sterigmatocystin 8-O-methyltransferase [Diaporthaceae sp. PMI_573]